MNETDMTGGGLRFESATSVASAPTAEIAPGDELVEEELLLEEISIDGMCGVY